MSDELETNNEQATDQIASVDEPQGETSSEIDWKAEARKWEKRAKDAQGLREAAEKWQEYEASLKPMQERMAEELQAAKRDAETARLTLTRYEVAAEKGVPSDAIKLLQGETREQLEDAADTLLALIASQSKPKSPKPDSSQGRPASGGTSVSDQFANAIGDII